MFGWFKRKPKQPPRTIMVAKVASVIDAFISQEGWEEFSNNRLSVVIHNDFRVSISAGRFIKDGLVAVPLDQLLLQFSPSETSGTMRHVAVDMAATTVVDRLPPNSN